MSGFSLNSAERCLAILELLVEHAEGLPLTTISTELQLPASAAHRLLGVLAGKGYVRQDELSSRYAPTMVVAGLGLRLLARYHVPDVCQPILDDLAAKSGELVRLSFVEDDRLIWIAKAQGSRSNLRYDPITGHHVPLHVTAMGKAWLATMPEAQALASLASTGYTAEMMGPRAIRDETTMRRELAATRERGYGLVEEEAEAGVSAIAMVVTDGTHAGAPPVATVSIAGPSVRLSTERLHALAPQLREAAHALARVWSVRRYQAGSQPAQQAA